MNNNAAAIYGGGYNSDVTGDIFIHIKENSLISEETVWGGGTGDSTITGGVTITVDDSTEVIGEIHAGGNEGADVIGNVSITVSGSPNPPARPFLRPVKGRTRITRPKLTAMSPFLCTAAGPTYTHWTSLAK